MLHHIILAVGAGLFAYNGVFIRGEWHLHVPHIVTFHSPLWLGTVGFLYQAQDNDSLRGPFWRRLVLGACYLTTLFASMTIYRLYFHRLSKFPGPKMAAVSKLWHVFKIRDSTNFTFLQELHGRYGSVFRTGPNEITIAHPNALQILDGVGNQNSRDIWYDLLRPKSSAVFTRDEAEHQAGRKAWTRGISSKIMNSFNLRIDRHVQDVVDYLKTYDNEAVDIDKIVSRLVFDVAGDIVFNQDWNLVKSKASHPFFGYRDRAFGLVGPINDMTWPALMVFSMAPFWYRAQDWFKMVAFCEDRMKARIEAGEKEGQVDVATNFIDEYENIYTLHTLEERNLYLHGTAVTAVLAGSDTTRPTLIAIAWFLARYPEHAKKIRQEIENVDSHDPNILATLPHLDGFLHETLRMVPPDMTGGARITGPDGLKVGDILIPPDTKVVAPKYVIMRMESAFTFADRFIPERWYSRPELVREKRAFGPFSTGGRQCVGKSIAYAELRLYTAALVREFNIRFAPNYHPLTSWRDMKDQITA